MHLAWNSAREHSVGVSHDFGRLPPKRLGQENAAARVKSAE
jgi:hypothetical protein